MHQDRDKRSPRSPGLQVQAPAQARLQAPLPCRPEAQRHLAARVGRWGTSEWPQSLERLPVDAVQ